MEQINLLDIDIVPAIKNPQLEGRYAHHINSLKGVLQKLIPKEENISSWIDRSIPLLVSEEAKITPCILSIDLLCLFLEGKQMERAFLQALQKDLFFEKKSEITSFLHFLFKFSLKKETYFYARAEVLIESAYDLQCFYNNISIIEKDLLSSLSSFNIYKSDNGLQEFPKPVLVNKDLKKILAKRPEYFDNKIFSEATKLSILAPENFEQQRSHRHISRIVCSLYLLRKSLRKKIHLNPEKRHLQIRFLLATLYFTFGQKTSLGLSIGVNLFSRKEFLEEQHIEAALKKRVKSAQVVKHSFFSYVNPQDQIRTIYLEIEKIDGAKFSLAEIKELKKALPEELKGHIEKTISPIFYVPNEEETMKDILHLSAELTRVSDIPQITLSFLKRDPKKLVFRLVIVRVIKKGAFSLEKLLQFYLPFSIDRQQIVGFLRKKYPKEASVLHISIPLSSSLVRDDSSINLYLAREKILSTIEDTMGEVRDYNGGLLLKQTEMLTDFKAHFSNKTKLNPDFLDEFFYAITPIEAQAILPLDALICLFEILLKLIAKPLEEETSYQLAYKYREDKMFIGIYTTKEKIKKQLLSNLRNKHIPQKDYVSTTLKHDGNYFFGAIYSHDSEEKKMLFQDCIKNALDLVKQSSTNRIRINCIHNPISLDPRIGGDEHSKIPLRGLFEGLMSTDEKGGIHFAIAKSVDISEDRRTYTFHLKKTYWSNKSRVVAHDFEYAWKKVLSPGFKTRFSFTFYTIKNAKKAKEGGVSSDEVGVKAIDDNTLKVVLENPAPYFLELTALTLFSPINHKIDKTHPNWAFQEGEKYVCNGPYVLEKSNPYKGYILKKNPNYWDANRVHLDEVRIKNTDIKTALDLFKKNKVDYIQLTNSLDKESSDNLNKLGVKYTEPKINTRCVINVGKFPFHNKKIRQAFYFSIDRTKLLEDLGYNYLPAYSFLPYPMIKNIFSSSGLENLQKARSCFAKGLEELNIKEKDFPRISILSSNMKGSEKMVLLLKEQWESKLGVSCEIRGADFYDIFKKSEESDFQLIISGWVSVINDPIYTFDQFRGQENKINFSKWNSDAYCDFLKRSDLTANHELRYQLLKKAEDKVLKEVAVIPLFHKPLAYFQRADFRISHNKVSGIVDLNNTCKI